MYKCLLLAVAWTLSTTAVAAPPAVIGAGDAAGQDLLESAVPADLDCDQIEVVAEDPLAIDLGLTWASDCFICTASSQCQSYCGGGTPGFDFACIYEEAYGHRCCACL